LSDEVVEPPAPDALVSLEPFDEQPTAPRRATAQADAARVLTGVIRMVGTSFRDRCCVRWTVAPITVMRR
jgi:hypothetical protein